MKPFLRIAGLSVIVTFAIASVAQDPPSANSKSMSAKTSSLSMADKKFVKEAAQGGMAEVELGQLAQQKASSDDVKKFGERMVNDHSKANDQLKQIASDQGISLPSQMSAKDNATKAMLSKLSGKDFDRAYMADMVKDHRADISEFEKESSSGKDPAIKDFAQQTLPTLRDHLKQAEEVHSSVKSTMSATSSMKK
jgi:putative membrane protein